MFEGSGPSSFTLDLAGQKSVDQRCSQFELAWKQGKRPRLDDFIGGVADAERLVLLQELVYLDVAYRCRLGEQPTAKEYHARFPELDLPLLKTLVAEASTLGPVLPAAATTGSEKTATNDTVNPEDGVHIRCPHCHNPIHLTDRRPDQVLCPGCGSGFRLRDSHLTSTISAMKPLGKFQLLERVGIGAFGAVWRARDTELDRIVALKIPHAGLLASRADVERFHREARSAAQLRHPGIVTVHEVATLEGLPTLVADFIEGVPLRDYLETHRLTFPEAADLVADLADALDYAHAMAVIHRDIKPANIMLELGKKAARGTRSALAPRIMDFGLALREDAEITMTLEGQIIGTPTYMSPEQAAGKGHAVDPRSDLYSLGVVLYEVLCGELPFRGSKMMILHQVLNEEPRPPRRLNDKIPRDLETICLKCLQKEPAKRYASAKELADDLARFRQGMPIKARPLGRAERAWRWCRRNPVVAGLSMLLVLVLLGSLGVMTGLWLRAEKSRSLAEDHLKFALGLMVNADIGAARELGPQGFLHIKDKQIQRGYLVKMKAEKVYVLDSQSEDFSTHLLVLDLKHKLLDQGRTIFFVPPREETYKVVVTFIEPGLGNYTLNIREEDPLEVGDDGIKVAGTLTSTDVKDRLGQNTHARVFHVRLAQGSSYTIELSSPAFDAQLRLEDSARQPLAKDDNGGGESHSRIAAFQPVQDGIYRIVVAATASGGGNFTLKVRGEPAGKNQPPGPRP